MCVSQAMVATLLGQVVLYVLLGIVIRYFFVLGGAYVPGGLVS